MKRELKALGTKVTEYTELETFKRPASVDKVTLTSDEVTALCPVTGQADWYTVSVTYVPRDLCIESKTFKLLMGSFRNKGLFCEALSSEILEEVIKHAHPRTTIVEITQKPRGGVTLIARATSFAE